MADHEITLYPSRFGGFMVVCSCGKDLLEEGTRQVLLDELNRLAHEHIEAAEVGQEFDRMEAETYLRANEQDIRRAVSAEHWSPVISQEHIGRAYGAESAVTSEDSLIDLGPRVGPGWASG